MLSGNSVLLLYDVYVLGLHDLMSFSTSKTVALVADLPHDSNARKCKLSIRPFPFKYKYNFLTVGSQNSFRCQMELLPVEDAHLLDLIRESPGTFNLAVQKTRTVV